MVRRCCFKLAHLILRVDDVFPAKQKAILSIASAFRKGIWDNTLKKINVKVELVEVIKNDSKKTTRILQWGKKKQKSFNKQLRCGGELELNRIQHNRYG